MCDLLKEFIQEVKEEIDCDCRLIESDYQRITRLEIDINEAKERIKTNNYLLFKLKELYKEENKECQN